MLADGRFHEKAALQRAVREAAAERGVMLAFIILDNPAASLLDMQTVRNHITRPLSHHVTLRSQMNSKHIR